MHPEPAITTAVCCVEFGRLEEQTVMMVRSLRKFGGKLASIPVLAVIGRFGAPLRPATVLELERLGVTIVKAKRSANPATWFNYGNKAAAVITADRLAETDQVTWLDSDIFFIGEPQTLTLEAGEDLAIALNALPPIVTPDDDTHQNYWRRLCALFGVDFDELPWVEVDGKLQKPNCNSGAFTWRRGTGFAQRYWKGFHDLLDARLAQFNGEFFTVDQVILVPLAHGLKWKAISREDHTFVATDQFIYDKVPSFEGVRLLHYSNSFNGPYRDEMKQRVRAAAPALMQWLDGQQFDAGPMGGGAKALAKVLRTARGLRYRLYDRRTIRVA